MPEPEARSDAYEAARERALAWLTAHWDPGLTAGEWWARLAESGWGFPTWPEPWFGKGMSADEAAGVRAAYASTGALGPPAQLAALWARETTNGYLARGGQSARDARRPSAQGSLSKLARSQLVRAGREAGMSVLGAHGMLESGDGPGQGEVQLLALSSPGASIAGGTDEIQRGIVGERVLGLPKEPRQDRDVPFRDLTVGTQRPRD